MHLTNQWYGVNIMKKLLILGLCVFASTAALANDELFMKLDADSNGLISISEATADSDVAAQFAELDTNADGFLAAEEFAEY
jgi:Ca2+-binding EF-hand superfamily protein